MVGCFENGFDALENGISLSPDILITDIRMPYIDGIDLIKHFKREFPLLQSIIVSGYDSFDYAKEAISLGVVGYLTKPIFKDEFIATLNKAKEIADSLGLMENVDYGFIDDCCKTDLTPEFTDENGVGRCRVGIWFKPLPDETAHIISKKFKLYRS